VPHEFLYAEYNDLGSVRRLLEENQPEVAAILVEPMQGVSGCIAGETEFLTGLRARCPPPTVRCCCSMKS
jgi:glutamate-1-semialdehyde 2,1-aminomutase